MNKKKSENNKQDNKPKIGEKAKMLIGKQLLNFFQKLFTENIVGRTDIDNASKTEALISIWNLTKRKLKPFNKDKDLEPWFKFDRDCRWILKETDKFLKTSRYFGDSPNKIQIIQGNKVTNPRMFVAVSDSLYKIYLEFHTRYNGGWKLLSEKRFRRMFEKRYNVKIHPPRYYDTDKRIYKTTSLEFKNEIRKFDILDELNIHR